MTWKLWGERLREVHKKYYMPPRLYSNITAAPFLQKVPASKQPFPFSRLIHFPTNRRYVMFTVYVETHDTLSVFCCFFRTKIKPILRRNPALLLRTTFPTQRVPLEFSRAAEPSLLTKWIAYVTSGHIRMICQLSYRILHSIHKLTLYCIQGKLISRLPVTCNIL